MRISACMIVKNEEMNISKCINSYKDIVEEIIVVDTGSTDNTIEIAQSLGAVVYHYKWIDDFSKAKNYALSKAKGDWVIFLDADEYFGQNQSENIPNLIAKYGNKNTQILACKMFNIDEDSGENLADFVQSRIFKRNGNIYYKGAIHERLISKNINRNINALYIEENELVIYHTGYSKNRILSKAERNLEILLAELHKPEVDPSVYHFLGDTYLTLQDFDKSIEFTRKFLDKKVNLVGLNSKVYQNLITAMIEGNYEWAEIYKVIEEATAEFPDHPMFQFYLAKSHHSIKRYQEALVSYLMTIELQEKYNGIEINFITGKIHEIEYPIAVIYEYKNDNGNALEYYIKALQRKKDYGPALQGLVKLISTEEASKSIEILNNLYDRNNIAELTLLVEELTKQRNGQLLAYYVSHMIKKFNHQDFSMVIMFLATGRYEHAYKHFKEAYQINFENSYSKLALISAYLNDNHLMLLEMKNIVKPSFKRIIDVLIPSKIDSFLDEEDIEDYLDILGELSKLNKEAHIDRFIKLRDKFCFNLLGKEVMIGNVLKNNGLYEKALEQFRNALAMDNFDEDYEIDRKSLYFMSGYCYYKLRNMEKALEYFDKALSNGYLENDIRDFILWSKDQTQKPEVKSLALKLIEQFDVIKSGNL